MAEVDRVPAPWLGLATLLMVSFGAGHLALARQDAAKEEMEVENMIRKLDADAER